MDYSIYFSIIWTFWALLAAPVSRGQQAAMIVDKLECTHLMNYDTRDDASTGCIFVNIRGNSSVYFTVSDTYKGFPIDLEAFEIVEFHNSSLDRLPPKLLEYFKATEVLDVSNCNMQQICGLEGGTKLRELRAKNNRIKNLGENIFAHNRKLSVLDLSHNEISYLRQNIFTRVPYLQHLDLSYNEFGEMSPAFQHLHHLRVFDLTHNSIEQIFPITGLHRLETLNLSENFIGGINADAFMKMKNLKTLQLRKNSLLMLFLQFNSSVNYVDVSHNLLQELEIVSNIATLDASHNKLSFLIARPGIQIFSLNLSTNLFKDVSGIRSLRSLRHLNLAANHLNYLTSRSFWNLDNLIELDISRNFLKHINLYHFANLNYLQYLRLSSNDITRMKLTHTSFDKILPQLKELALAGNPWNCKYLIHMVNSFGQRGVRLVNDINDVLLNDFEGVILNIPCHKENKLEECRYEMESLKASLDTEIERLKGIIEELESVPDLDNSTSHIGIE